MAFIPDARGNKVLFVLFILLAFYLCVECLIPLRTAIQIGGDEGFVLAKATLCLKGYKLYTDIWNDQPPLHTFLITEILKHFSSSVLGPRLLSVGFGVLLLAAIFSIVLRINGLTVAALTVILTIASPGFIALSGSCMQEIPALSLAMSALCILISAHVDERYFQEALSGLVLGFSLEMKLIDGILLPLFILVLWLRHCQFRAFVPASLIFGLGLTVSFIGVDCVIDQGAFFMHIQQSWASHFGPVKSFEYGSARDYPFDWKALLRNWDTSVLAVIGVCFLLTKRGKIDFTIFPVVWLALELLIFSIHRPWWPYYYVHITEPLCWCAAIGIMSLWKRVQVRRWGRLVIFSVFVIGTVCWMGCRVYLQIKEIQESPQTYDSIVLNEIQQYKPSTKWMYADEQIYSFYSGIPVPPPLAILTLKRLWSGDMTNARIVEEIEKYKPELILLKNDQRPVPFQSILESKYRLTYEDSDLRLYYIKTASN